MDLLRYIAQSAIKFPWAIDLHEQLLFSIIGSWELPEAQTETYRNFLLNRTSLKL